MRPILSICIPTYNRAEIVERCVREVLRYEGKEIEVVVCDNGSTDHTQDLLSAIEDSRLKIFKNEENLGVTKNVYKVIQKASSSFAFILSDEDGIIKEDVGELIRFLKVVQEKNIEMSALVTSASKDLERDLNKFEQIFNIFSGRGRYCSGVIYNKRFIQEKDYEVQDTVYPTTCLLYLVALRGNVVFTNFGGWYKRESSKFNGITEYIKPLSRLAQMVQEIELVDRTLKDEELKIEIFKIIFMAKILQGTIIYELILRNAHIRKYYEINRNSEVSYEDNFKEAYLKLIKEKVSKKCWLQNRREVEAYIKYIDMVRSTREEYVELTEKKQIPCIVVGSVSYIKETTNLLQNYNFKVGYICAEEFHEIEIEGVIRINLKEVEEFDKCVLVVSSQEEDYINKIYSLNTQEVHLFYSEQLSLKT